MKKIELTRGMQALVDDVDFDWLSQWKWSFDGKYAHRMNKDKKEYMHRRIMGFPAGLQVDHINGVKLDNQRSNLRTCDNAQNNSNRGLQSTNPSGFKGLYFAKDENVWVARLKHHGKYIYLGRYRDKLLAARAYNEAALEYHGEFAVLNGGV
jgi:hypothetical protein